MLILVFYDLVEIKIIGQIELIHFFQDTLQKRCPVVPLVTRELRDVVDMPDRHDPDLVVML